MNELKNYHPIVNMVYFLFVIGFAMFLLHPLCLGAALLCSLSYSAVLKGKKALKTELLWLLPLMLVTALLNPAFNHEGATVLAYLPGGNPLTLESVLYGVGIAVMLASVIGWFSCYNAVMTSDKFIYLFGRVIPSLSLVLSMTLRFAPRFAAQIKVVSNAQRCMGRDVSNGSVIRRAKHGLSILSVMVTWALENSIETADSMKSRGYGLPGRTAFSVFRFDRRDGTVLGILSALGGYVLAGCLAGQVRFRYFPTVQGAGLSAFSVSVFAAYFALCALPLIMEISGVRKWKVIESKI